MVVENPHIFSLPWILPKPQDVYEVEFVGGDKMKETRRVGK
jgi:hypothetical protein